MIRVGIIGSTGYAGQQLTWLVSRHPKTKIVFLSSHNHANIKYSNIYCQYRGIIDKACVSMQEAEEQLVGIDVLFIALPHGKSFDIIERAIGLGIKVIDLGGDFRFKSPSTYEKWYGIEHRSKEVLKDAVYGLTELNRDTIKKANLISNPGCYPTASILAMAPLIQLGLIDINSIIIDAKSGVSGAGRNANIQNLFSECNESIRAYGVGVHRHTPEIEQELSRIGKKEICLNFTPHLVPMNRGILATCYSNLNTSISEEELLKIYKDYYSNDYFVKIIEDVPETKWVKGSNFCHIGVNIDKRTNRVIVISAIDNLIKGAAGQGIQNMNLMLGFDEAEGLEFLSLVP